MRDVMIINRKLLNARLGQYELPEINYKISYDYWDHSIEPVWMIYISEDLSPSNNDRLHIHAESIDYFNCLSQVERWLKQHFKPKAYEERKEEK